MSPLLLIGFGGFLGAVSRYGVYLWVPPLPLSPSFQLPMGTLSANLAGCLLAGLRHGSSWALPTLGEEARIFLFTGFLGSFTTLSTFGVEVYRLFQEGHLMVAGAYLVVTVFLGLAFVAFGHLVSSWVVGA